MPAGKLIHWHSRNPDRINPNHLIGSRGQIKHGALARTGHAAHFGLIVLVLHKGYGCSKGVSQIAVTKAFVRKLHSLLRSLDSTIKSPFKLV